MAHFDLPLSALETFRPDRDEPADFDAFWADTLAEARGLTWEPRFTPVGPVDSGVTGVDVDDVEFAGFGGHPIRAWLVRPRGVDGPLPCVVQYIGYNSGRGLAHQHTLLPAAGFAVLVMDTRGQGSGALPGATPDPVGSAPHTAGRLTDGIDDPAHAYYRRVFCDAVLAIDAARAHPAIDGARVSVWGGSQGGGIALAAAALSDGLRFAAIDFPFLSGIRRAVSITDAAPYSELVTYLQTRRGDEEQVFRTLSYLDGVNFAARARVPALFSVGLMDAVCPPSTVFAAYNHYAGEKGIRVYSYNGHEGGGPVHQREMLRALAARG
ncbi:cephalosporin-C deacetylase [Microbacterium testaceum]|uniref:acetylxylan esterase n=1 Tax=Microbacterium testaceum TaxID=2033 RepID=UPI002784E7E1|nr:acetylxylan esterase [Microbacterium testaceum]MDQ1171810.1 cephalosporin-C deacetylase [Microbacterium testaceum]